MPAPAARTPTSDQFFSKNDPSKPDLAFLKNHFFNEGRLTEEQALWILHQGTQILRAEPNLLDVEAPVTGSCAAKFARTVFRPCSFPPRSLVLQCVEIYTANSCVQSRDMFGGSAHHPLCSSTCSSSSRSEGILQTPGISS